MHPQYKYVWEYMVAPWNKGLQIWSSLPTSLHTLVIDYYVIVAGKIPIARIKETIIY